MDVYQHNTATSVATSQPLPDKFDLMASLTNGGKVTIEIDGKVAAEGNAHMLFMEELAKHASHGRRWRRVTRRSDPTKVASGFRAISKMPLLNYKSRMPPGYDVHPIRSKPKRQRPAPHPMLG